MLETPCGKAQVDFRERFSKGSPNPFTDFANYLFKYPIYRRTIVKFLTIIIYVSGIALFPSAARADDQFKILIFATASKYHYEFIPIARDSLTHMARQHSFGLVWADKPDVFDSDLHQYAAVMFLNTPAEQLSPAERSNFEAYMRAGGNAIVVHRAAIIPPDAWPWYEQLVGRRVGTHPMLQTGVVTIVDSNFPATYGIADRWIWSDEFYPTTNPYGVTIKPVLNVDETSYDPTKIWPGQTAKGMGKDHPVAWYHPYENGRVFVTTLGHNGDDYSDPQYLKHLLGGIYWTATGRGRLP